MNDVRYELARISKELYRQGLLTSTGGNLSFRDPGHPDQIWITPSHVNKGELTFDVMTRIDLDGNPIDHDHAPSIEKQIHSQVMKNNPSINAVAHTHPFNAFILTLAGYPFLSLSVEATLIGEIPRIPFFLPGSKELGIAAAQALQNHPAALLQNHGLVTAGETLQRAADLSMIIEDNARKILACKMLGFEPPIIQDEQVRVFREKGQTTA